RAGGSGVAVTLVDWDDLDRWSMINTALALPFAEPPETYSTSAHLYEALDIPRGAAGRLPRSERTRAGLEAETVEDIGTTGARRARTRPSGRDNKQPASPPARQRREAPTGGDRREAPAAAAGGAAGRSRPRRRTRRGGSQAAGEQTG
ncbi:MAG: hypothetical protein LC640_06205, partial [Frankia sp.]|nr:hypothetical protein [Frankia sp.]